jgi:hypothetical protein
MGQYQQWLFAQEIDRRLKMEIETLETELLYLQDRITILEQTVPETENTILQALLVYLQSHESQQRQGQEESASTQAQPDWRGLPRLETPPAQIEGAAPYVPGLHSRTEMVGDMLAFFDKHGQADPQLSIWLQNERKRAMRASGDEHVVDEETRRLNESIQRWFERWHRQISGVTQSEELQSEQ